MNYKIWQKGTFNSPVYKIINEINWRLQISHNIDDNEGFIALSKSLWDMGIEEKEFDRVTNKRKSYNWTIVKIKNDNLLIEKSDWKFDSILKQYFTLIK